jgi:hypothetical protein
MRYMLIAAAALLVGCAKMPYGSINDLTYDQWTHPTKSIADFRNDEYECARDNPSIRRARASAMRERCMIAKGWGRK